MLKGNGGLVAYLETNDAREVQKRVDQGDEKATLIYKAMAYQIAKQIMSLFPGADSKIDAVVLTGGIANDKRFLTKWITDMISHITKVILIPGEEENLALAQGVLRVLNNEESPKHYS